MPAPSGACVTIAVPGCCVTHLDPIPRRNPEQIGRAPDQIVLKLGDAAVHIGDLQQHLNDALTTGHEERALQHAAEIKEIEEFNIGHSIISRAIFFGMERAVREMLSAMSGMGGIP